MSSDSWNEIQECYTKNALIHPYPAGNESEKPLPPVYSQASYGWNDGCPMEVENNC